MFDTQTAVSRLNANCHTSRPCCWLNTPGFRSKERKAMKTTLKPIFSNFKEDDPCPNLAKPSEGVAIHPDLQSTFQERCNASDCARQDSLQTGQYTWTQLKFCNDKNWLSFTLKWPKGAFKPLSNASTAQYACGKSLDSFVFSSFGSNIGKSILEEKGLIGLAFYITTLHLCQ